MTQPFELLEQEFAAFSGGKHAVSVNTGTAALHLALAALRIGPGDEVIVPEFTMAACAFAVLYTGATPVFIDCADDLNLDVRLLRDALTENTKAIMPVHVYGRACRMDIIMDFADAYELKVIEDCSEAHGATWQGKKVGTFGAVGAFSFYRNKIVHAQEGGICITDDLVLADRMRDLKNMAFGDKHDYMHSELAFNYRMPNGQASMARDSLRLAAEHISKRAQVAAWYDKHLGHLALPRPEGSVVWVYDLVCGKEAQERILEAVPGSRPFFKPMGLQPFCRKARVGPRALEFSKIGVYLPVHERMKREDVEGVCTKVVAALAK